MISDKRETLQRNSESTTAQIESLEKDAARLDWINSLCVNSWNGVTGVGSTTLWSLSADYRHYLINIKGHTFRAAIDAAMLGDSHVR